MTDNVGRELLPDLVLADRLLSRRMDLTLQLHVKPSPYFTSDATPADVLKTVQRLIDGPPAASEIGHRLRGFLISDQLSLVTHPFYVAPLSYFEAPSDLQKSMRRRTSPC